MNVSELHSKNVVDLDKELLALKKIQFGLRLRHKTQQLENTAQIKSVRRDIARIKTFLSHQLVKIHE